MGQIQENSRERNGDGRSNFLHQGDQTVKHTLMAFCRSDIHPIRWHPE